MPRTMLNRRFVAEGMRRFLLAIAALELAAGAAGAGSLDPPGAPAPTMKTLQEMEPRTAISSIPITISAPGSYYLTGDLSSSNNTSHGITITASSVTLDLRGFSIIGPGTGATHGIFVSGAQNNTAVHNGTLRNWGGSGIHAYSSPATQIRNLRTSSNGQFGMYLGGESRVSDSTATSNGYSGISVSQNSAISGCVSSYNTGDGISTDANTTVTACATSFNQGFGIAAGGGSNVIRDCAVTSNSLSGIVSGRGSLISHCVVEFNTKDGIFIGSDSYVFENECVGNGSGLGVGAGIHASGDDTRIEANNVSQNDFGILLDVGGNFVVKNSSSGNGAVPSTDNYVFNGTNTTGAIVTATGTISADPWANFSY